jgi:adenylate kinase family enzyme
VALASARRILILGPSGSGKSTLASRLGGRLRLPVIHLDAHYWQPGWVESERADFQARVAKLADQPAWVIDGNYSYTLDSRLARADQLIYIHASRWRCLVNVFKRWLAYHGRQRPDMSEGCPEKIDLEFLQWVLWVQPQGRSESLRRLRSSGKPLTELRAGAPVERLLQGLEPVAPGGSH